MTPTQMMIYGALTAVAGIALAALNMFVIFRKNPGLGFGLHFVFGLTYIAGGLCAVAGFVLFCIDRLKAG